MRRRERRGGRAEEEKGRGGKEREKNDLTHPLSQIHGHATAYLCNLVHFWRPVQQKMYSSVFNLDFGRSV